MKYAVFFVLCYVALSSAAPQVIVPGIAPGFIAPGVYAPGVVAPGVVAPGVVDVAGLVGPRTLVAGPTVINGVPGGQIIAPGVIGTTVI
ncbi:neuropeptide-like 3 [Galleria mellonella]|uniref:Neuropeptide-like 3 n=1 Tax=Galleria mellonella TaxID=7137 RepID=A0A6J3C7F9_GALME|nr:neuropeptide-like 3 [Galleria mellonella]